MGDVPTVAYGSPIPPMSGRGWDGGGVFGTLFRDGHAPPHVWEGLGWGGGGSGPSLEMAMPPAPPPFPKQLLTYYSATKGQLHQ